VKTRVDRFKQKPVIVVGSGIAGLLLSLELAKENCKVVLVTKGRLAESNTAWAQGGLAAVTGLNAVDTKEQHLADTLAAGDGLTDPVVAERVIADGALLVQKLAEHGVKFDPASLALEGGHRMARVLHSADATGRAIVDALISTVRKNKMIRIVEDCFLREIIVENNKAVGISATLYTEKQKNASHELCHKGCDEEAHGTEIEIDGRAVVMATGGLGQVYERTTNPATATGDGITVAYDAGAHLVDMEFVQFHPTALHLNGAPAFLISEAARGAGAVLVNEHGERFAFKYHAAGELATRDIVSRAIFSEMQANGTDCVYLDMRPIGEQEILKQFPNIVEKLRSFGIDPVSQPIPVSPAAHYFMGGILADECGRTTVESLYAIGECASTGLHGANRLASNSLLEGGVMALKLAIVLSSSTGRGKTFQPAFGKYFQCETTPGTLGTFDRKAFKHDILNAAGLIRTEAGLKSFIVKHEAAPPVVSGGIVDLEDVSIHALGIQIAKSALIRTESVGAHWRADVERSLRRADSTHRPALAPQTPQRLVVHKHGYAWLPIVKPVEVMPSPVASVPSV